MPALSHLPAFLFRGEFMSSEKRSSEWQREDDQQLTQSAVVEQPVTESTAKRTQYETFDIEPTDHGVNSVRNEGSESADGHSYRMTVKDRVPVFCASRTATYHGGAYERRIAISIFEPNLESTTSSEGDREPKIATDGGRAIKHSSESEQPDRRPMDCGCLPTFDDLPCWPCYRNGFRTPNPNATLDD